MKKAKKQLKVPIIFPGRLLEGDLVLLECEMSICLIPMNPFVILESMKNKKIPDSNQNSSHLPQLCCGPPPSVCSRPSASAAPPLAPPAASAEAAAPPIMRQDLKLSFCHS